MIVIGCGRSGDACCADRRRCSRDHAECKDAVSLSGRLVDFGEESAGDCVAGAVAFLSFADDGVRGERGDGLVRADARFC